MEEKQEQIRQRRPNVEEEEIAQMRQLEAEGKPRSEIASTMRCSRSVVTRRLGAKRKYTRRGVSNSAESV